MIAAGTRAHSPLCICPDVVSPCCPGLGWGVVLMRAVLALLYWQASLRGIRLIASGALRRPPSFCTAAGAAFCCGVFEQRSQLFWDVWHNTSDGYCLAIALINRKTVCSCAMGVGCGHWLHFGVCQPVAILVPPHQHTHCRMHTCMMVTPADQPCMCRHCCCACRLCASG